jgi:hypothetical protein
MRTAWVVSALLAAGLGAVLVASALDALVAVVPALRSQPLLMTGVVVSFAGALVPPWLAFRGGMGAFHRHFGPVWLVRTAALPAKTVCLGARRAIPLEPKVKLPAASMPPWMAIALGLGLGLAVAGAGLAEYHFLGLAEQRGEPISRVWLELVVYSVGGRAAVLGMFVAMGVAVSAWGFVGASGIREHRRRKSKPPTELGSGSP